MNELLEESIEMWQACPDSLPDLGLAYTRAEQSIREAHLATFLDVLQGQLRDAPRTADQRHETHARITMAFAEFARQGLGFEQRHLDLMLDGGFSAIGTTLARRARSLDAQVSVADIFQANRNAWTACGLEVLFGKKMVLTPSIFAYSMLYPYTDNYLDDPAIPLEIKHSFSLRFAARLDGQRVAPANLREETIWKLVELIEQEYDRSRYPMVFASLLGIQRAQVESVRLLRGAAAPAAVDVLRLSLAKGGTSVLADGYLAGGGELTPDQARFAFNWGVLLQLADDLQDVAEDRARGIRTLFSQSAGPLDALTSRTLSFGAKVMELMRRLSGHGLSAPEASASGASALEELLERSCYSLIVRSAGEARSFYTQPYIERLELYSPFGFEFLAERRRLFARRSGMLVRVFEAFLAGEAGEPAFPLLPSSLMPRF